MRRPRPIATLIVLALLLAGAAALRLFLGGAGTTPDQTAQLLWLRAARVVAAIAVGASLGASGVFLQCLLRNPLASPDLLGLASGAGLGVMISVYIGYLAGLGIAHAGAGGISASAAAIIGSLAALAFVYILSQRRGLLDPVTLVLVGVVVSVICSAATTLLKQLMPDQGLAASRLLMGSLRDDVTWRELGWFSALTLVCVGTGAWAGRAMDAASLGEDEARSVGVPLGALRTLLFLLAGILAAGSVVLAGPIGFVGLVCPHAVRLTAGPGHRILTIGAALAGALLVLLADALVRSVDLGSGRIPIGVLTSLVGGPVLVGLLRKALRGAA